MSLDEAKLPFIQSSKAMYVGLQGLLDHEKGSEGLPLDPKLASPFLTFFQFLLAACLPITGYKDFLVMF